MGFLLRGVYGFSCTGASAAVPNAVFRAARHLQKLPGRNSIATMLRKILVGLIVMPGALVIASCGGRAVGYGIVLWGELAGAPQTGAVVSVIQSSTIGSSLLISIPGERAPREYPAGRIRVFKNRGDASAFAAKYAASLGSWAVVVKEDSPPLPIRDAAAQEGKIVYRLQYRQLVKVISRSADRVTVKPYADYWYEVTTNDGYTGWCFGHFLKTFAATGDPTPQMNAILSQDETLARIMGTTWRPTWFGDMITNGAIDLSMLREDVGLFPSPADRIMKLVLPLSTFEFHYTGEPQKVGAASYLFTGTDLRIDVLGDDRINVTWRYKGQPKTDPYVSMKEDIAAVVAAEQQRRADIYAALKKKGATLVSSAYGTIRLLDDMRFTWSGFSALVPSLIGPEAKGKGSVDFTLRVGKQIAGDYDGALTFVFDEYSDTGVSFLYKAAGDGLRFISLARNSVQDLAVVHPSTSPVVIFFSQSP
jgi:hypothetical protein